MLYTTLPFSERWGQSNTDTEWRDKTYNMWKGKEGQELVSCLTLVTGHEMRRKTHYYWTET
jgi:hypothetical protein